MKALELLAPAGSFEALQAAVAAGADAVYMGGTRQNARMAAKNFDEKAIAEAIRYAKLRKVKAYITLNTLNFGQGFEQTVATAKKLEEMGADALILQDIGLICAIAQETKLPLHASTQCGIHNQGGVLACKQLGMDRVILAREMTIDQIKVIARQTDMELEAFVHGALCSSFSGQCYYSWYKGGRSGNCGSCAQPCRLPYGQGYPLSTRDLCAIQVLPQLVDSGLTSLKIEGRLKRPEYVAITTACYKQALELVQNNRIYDAQKYKEALKKIYNRGGFTTGYYGVEKDIYGAATPNHRGELIGVVERTEPTKIHAKVDQKLRVYDGLSFGNKGLGMEISDLYYRNVTRVHEGIGQVSFSSILKGIEAGDAIYRTTDYLQMQWVKQLVQEYSMIRWLQGRCVISLEEASLTLTYEDTTVCHRLSKKPERALNKSIEKAEVQRSLEKLGGTVFRFDELEIQMHNGLFMAAKDLNKLRREAVEKMVKALTRAPERTNQPATPGQEVRRELPGLVFVSRSGKTRANADHNIYAPKSYTPASFRVQGFDGVVLPHITYDEDMEKIEESIQPGMIVVCNNIGQLQALRGKCRLWAGFGMNLVNDRAVQAAYELGAELVFQNFEQSEPLFGALRLKKGRIALMHFATCPNEARVGCERCNNKLEGLEIDCQSVVNKTARLFGTLQNETGEIVIED